MDGPAQALQSAVTECQQVAPNARSARAHTVLQSIKWRQAATDRHCTWALKKLLMLLNPNDLASTATSLQPVLLELGPDPYGSQVLSCYVVSLAKALAATGDSKESVLLAGCCEDLCQPIMAGHVFQEWAKDPCASVVLQKLFLVCSGYVPPASSPQMAGNQPPEPIVTTLPQSRFAAPAGLKLCSHKLIELLQSFATTDRVPFLTGEWSAPLVIFALLVLQEPHTANISLLRSLSETILWGSTPGFYDVLDVLAASRYGALVLENVLRLCPEDLVQEDFCRKYLFGHLNFWACKQNPPKEHLLQNTMPQKSNGSVTFLLTAAGSAKHFKPEKDSSQWRGRRDAHSRCTAASLWLAEGQAFPGVNSCILLYEDASLFYMTPDLVQRCPVPTESQLIGRWKDAALQKPIPGLARNAAPAEGAAALQSVFSNILQRYDASRTAVVLLHEDYPLELPVFGQQMDTDLMVDHVIFCLGAVRDMTDAEETALVAACQAARIHCVGCNLGRTAEFSSKIIHAINGHHINQRLLPAVNALVAQVAADPSTGLRLDRSTLSRSCSSHDETVLTDIHSHNPDTVDMDYVPAGTTTVFHFVTLCPVKLSAISPEIDQRTDLYHIVQACVCSLWRSRVAGRNVAMSGDWISKLTLICSDGGLLTVDGSLVEKLAQQHQAAPSEFQVLQALQQAIQEQLEAGNDSTGQDTKAVDGELTAIELKQLRSRLKQELLRPYEDRQLNVLELEMGKRAEGMPNLSQLAYRHRCQCGKKAGVSGDGSVTLFIFSSARPSHPFPNPSIASALQKVIKRHSTSPPLQASLSPTSLPMSLGLCLSLLQHFHYHGRLLPAILRLQKSDPEDTGNSCKDQTLHMVAGPPSSSMSSILHPPTSSTLPPWPPAGPALAAAAITRISTPHLLKKAIKKLDLKGCLLSSLNTATGTTVPAACIVSCAENCSRLGDLKLCQRFFNHCLLAFDMNADVSQSLWPILLALDTTATLTGVSGQSNFSVPGCQLAAAFLKFPSSTVIPLVDGYRWMLRIPNAATLLLQLGLNKAGSRLLEDCLRSTSALPRDLQFQTVDLLADSNGLQKLALDPSGGWVVSAAWTAVQDDTVLMSKVRESVRAVEWQLRRNKKMLLLRVVLGEGGSNPGTAPKKFKATGQQ